MSECFHSEIHDSIHRNTINSGSNEKSQMSRDENFCTHRSNHHTTHTPSGMLTSSTPIPAKHQTPVRSSDKEEPKLIIPMQHLSPSMKQRTQNSSQCIICC